jgi:enterochelin esterase family protein
MMLALWISMQRDSNSAKQPSYNAAMPASQVIIEEFHSQALEGNPLGDPATRRVPVYLPPDYDPAKRYPSLYLLAAYSHRGTAFLSEDLWEESVPQRLDRLIAAGRVRPLIAVMPDASTRYGGSQYLNSAATGRYEDSIVELVSYIDRKYPTLNKASARAAAGHSSGGFGALWLSMLLPELFGLAASHSGDLGFDLVYKPVFGELLRFAERAGINGLQGLLRSPAEAMRKGAPFLALDIMAMASVYSPNPEEKLGFDLPFDLATGAARPEIWAKWLAHDPIEAVEKYQDAVRGMKLLYFDCGRFDEYNLLFGARMLAKKLRELNIQFTFEEFEGGHRNVQYRFDTSFAAISAAFAD